MTLRRRTLLSLASLGLVLTACSGPAAEEEQPASDAAAPAPTGVTLAVGPLTTQNTLSLAVADGSLAQAVEQVGASMQAPATFPAFAPAAEAMAADRIDLTTGSSTAVVTALSGETDLAIFAVERNDDNTQGIVVSGDSGITDLAGLEGHSIAVNEGGTGEYLLRLALEQARLGTDDVEIVYLSPADGATAFAGGQVDAWATWDQYLVSAAALPNARVVAYARDLRATNRTVHVVGRAFADAHPEVVEAAYDALVATAEAVREDPSILEQAYVDAGATEEVARDVAARRPPRITPADAAFAEELRDVADFYARTGMIDEQVDTSEATLDISR